MEQGDRCGLFYRHKCLDDNDGEHDTEEFEDINVTHCAQLAMAQIDVLVGIPDGCFHHEQEEPPPVGTNAAPFFPQSTLVDTSLDIRDIRPLNVYQIVETNLGGGVELLADPGAPNGDGRFTQGVRVGPPGGTTLFVNEIRDITNLTGHVPIEFIKTSDIDEYDPGSGIVVRPNTNFINAINFGLPPGGNYFQYDRTTISVTFRGMTAGVPVVGVPNLPLGNVVLHRYGNAAGAPMVAAIFGTASVIMANAPFDYYESLTAVVPAAYRPTQTFVQLITGFRSGTLVKKIQFLTFLANGFIRFTPSGNDPANGPFEDVFIGGDNGLNIGISAGSVSYECVTS